MLSTLMIPKRSLGKDPKSGCSNDPDEEETAKAPSRCGRRGLDDGATHVRYTYQSSTLAVFTMRSEQCQFAISHRCNLECMLEGSSQTRFHNCSCGLRLQKAGDGCVRLHKIGRAAQPAVKGAPLQHRSFDAGPRDLHPGERWAFPSLD